MMERISPGALNDCDSPVLPYLASVALPDLQDGLFVT